MVENNIDLIEKLECTVLNDNKSRNTLQKILIVFSTTFPFFQAAGLIKIDYLLIIMAVISFMYLMQNKIYIYKSSSIYIILFFLMTISLLYSVDTEKTLIYLSVMLFGFLLYSTLARGAGLSQFLVSVVVSFSLVNVTITLYSVIFPSQFHDITAQLMPNLDTNFKYACGILGQTATNAYVISLSVIFYTVKMLTCIQKKIKDLLVLLLATFALICTGKRGPLLAVLIALIIVNAIYQKNNKTDYVKNIITTIIIAVIACGAFALFSNNNLVQSALERFSSLKNIDKKYSRVQLAEKAIAIFRESPILGIGAGAFNYYGMGAHNDYLQIMAENGIFGAFLFFVFIVLNFKISIKNYKANHKMNTLFFIGAQLFFMFEALVGTSFLHYGIFFIYIEIIAVCNFDF